MAHLTAVQQLRERIAAQEDTLEEIRTKIAASVAWQKSHKPGDVDESRTVVTVAKRPFWDWGQHGRAIGAWRNQRIAAMRKLVKLHDELRAARDGAKQK